MRWARRPGSGGDGIRIQYRHAREDHPCPGLRERTPRPRAGHPEHDRPSRILAPPFVRLVDGEGIEIPPFFLAFDTPPTLAVEESGRHELSFWLEENHLAGEIWLVVGGDHRIAVKNADPFELGSLDNQASRSFDGPDWRENP